jgi:Spy/CpxP family protein refolding chaperone
MAEAEKKKSPSKKSKKGFCGCIAVVVILLIIAISLFFAGYIFKDTVDKGSNHISKMGTNVGEKFSEMGNMIKSDSIELKDKTQVQMKKDYQKVSSKVKKEYDSTVEKGKKLIKSD